MKNPFIDERILNDPCYSDKGIFGCPLEEMLDFHNPDPGFYVEMFYGAVIGEKDVPPWKLTYISGELTDGFCHVTGQRVKALNGKTQHYDYLISAGESNGYLRVPERVVDDMKNHYEIPNGFEEWVYSMRNSIK